MDKHWLLLLAVLLTCLSSTDAHGVHVGPGTRDAKDYKFNGDVVHNKDHLKGHYDGIADINMDNISTSEMEFYYFKEHDDNDDGMLDGIELLNAFAHETIPDMEAITAGLAYSEKRKKQKEFIDEWIKSISVLVDELLKEEDKNNNGYLEYPEYMHARRAESGTS